MRPIPELSLTTAARNCKSPMIGKHRWVSDNCLNLSRTAAGSPGKNWGWHSTQISWTPVSCNHGPKDGSIKVETEILISRTWPAGSAFRKKGRSASTPSGETSKMARLPVRSAMWVTAGMISSGRQTKAIRGARCSTTKSRPPRQRQTLGPLIFQRLSVEAISLVGFDPGFLDQKVDRLVVLQAPAHLHIMILPFGSDNFIEVVGG